MTARTTHLTSGLVAHVPVDRFEIVNGPSWVRCLSIREALVLSKELDLANERGAYPYADGVFTLKTPASTTEFKRTLGLATIFAAEPDGSFQFTAIFSGRVVSGEYSPNSRTGWFNLD